MNFVNVEVESEIESLNFDDDDDIQTSETLPNNDENIPHVDEDVFKEDHEEEIATRYQIATSHKALISVDLLQKLFQALGS